MTTKHNEINNQKKAVQLNYLNETLTTEPDGTLKGNYLCYI